MSEQNKWQTLQEEIQAQEKLDEELTLPSQDKKTPEEITKLENDLDQANLLAESRKNDYMRILADMENLKRRNEKDLENAHKYGLEKLVRELLPVVDSLEKSLEHATDELLVKGVQMTLDLLLNALRKFNVTAVDPIKQPFNPTQQEAMSAVPTSEVPPNTVIQVLQKGYLIHDRLVRPALVIVSKAE